MNENTAKNTGIDRFAPCVCNGENACPGCNPEVAAELEQEIAEMDSRREVPPCLDCGAETLAEAQAKCICSGDVDDCHGCYLWPDDGSKSTDGAKA